MTFATMFAPRNLNTSFIENGIIYQWLIQRTPFEDAKDSDYKVEIETQTISEFISESGLYETLPETPKDLEVVLNRTFGLRSENIVYLRKETEEPLFNPTFKLKTIDERNDNILYEVPINILLNAFRIENCRDFIVAVGVNVITRFDKKIELFCSIYERSIKFDLYNNQQCVNDLNRSSIEYSFLSSLIESEEAEKINNAALVRSVADLLNYFYHSSSILLKNLTPKIEFLFYNQKTSDEPYLDIVVVNNCSSLLTSKYKSNELSVHFVEVIQKINTHLLN